MACPFTTAVRVVLCVAVLKILCDAINFRRFIRARVTYGGEGERASNFN
ncbi:hypothetical protein, unlikely [Trypanosoma brucei brucei TREU927]|uniref:Uncharacterized protein n=1 Tax=Trypanosoma brucei brucei (strain 927/4 GUTat10.1) TaxID=185431 RepID=Q38F69_TRYB2|nr:hypothetical protein, unlikely [Trypanosoma brucei brucei TREU927]EAN76551.1 hypothetical protein, unlikely [Trypanosoma brucei brucei TREU927]